MPSKAEQLFVALAMDDQAEAALTETLTARYEDAYIDSIQQQLDRLGIRRNARLPQEREKAHLIGLAERDARSIVETYNRELQNKIDALDFSQGLDALKAELRTWKDGREAWKSDQISRATQGNASDYAVTLFLQKNGLTGAKVIWFAQPSIVSNSHAVCVQRVRQGAVDWRSARDWERPHPNCRHKKQFLLQGVGDVKGEVWRG